MDKEQPTLHLLHGTKTRSLEHLLRFYKKDGARTDAAGDRSSEARQLEALEKVPERLSAPSGP